MRIFTLLGNTFLSVLFRFLTIVVVLEQTKGNSSKQTLCSFEFGCYVLTNLGDFLLFLT